MVMGKKKKKKAAAEEEARIKEQQKQAEPKISDYDKIYGDKDKTPKPGEGPTQPGGPGAPGAPGAGVPGAGMPPGMGPSFIPSQVMTCPNCSTVMTFSPSGGMFCIRCGHKTEK